MELSQPAPGRGDDSGLALRLKSTKRQLDEVLLACEADLNNVLGDAFQTGEPGQLPTWDTIKTAACFLERAGLGDDAELLRAEGRKYLEVVTNLIIYRGSRGLDAAKVRAWKAKFGEFPAFPDDPRLASDLESELKRVCRKVADVLSRHVKRIQSVIGGEPTPADKIHTPTAPECYVTLSQMAAIVNKSKRTLERNRDDGMLPAPAVKGGEGKADEWRWSDVRAILQEKYNRQLPATFPADRFVRR